MLPGLTVLQQQLQVFKYKKPQQNVSPDCEAEIVDRWLAQCHKDESSTAEMLTAAQINRTCELYFTVTTLVMTRV